MGWSCGAPRCIGMARRQLQLADHVDLDGLLTQSRELRRQCIRLQLRGSHGSRYVHRDPLLPTSSAAMRECARGIQQLQDANERLFAVYQTATAVVAPCAAATVLRRRHSKSRPRTHDCCKETVRQDTAETNDNVEAWVTSLLSQDGPSPSQDRIACAPVEHAAVKNAGVRRQLMHHEQVEVGLLPPQRGALATIDKNNASTAVNGDHSRSVTGPSAGTATELRSTGTSPVFSVLDSPSQNSQAPIANAAASTPKPKFRGVRDTAPIQLRPQAQEDATATRHIRSDTIDRVYVGNGACKMAVSLRR